MAESKDTSSAKATAKAPSPGKRAAAKTGGSVASDAPLAAGSAAVARPVDWPAILAGAVVASAIGFVLAAFGSALGLGFVDFDEGTPGTILVIALGLWSVAVALFSFASGGYIAGRLRQRLPDAGEHESDLRDGLHGLVVWGLGVLLGGALLTLGATGTAGLGARAAGDLASGAASATTAAAEGLDEAASTRLADSLLRPSNEAVSASAQANRGAARDEAGRILQGAGSDGLAEEDRSYLASLAARHTGLSQDEASRRVDEVSAELASLRQQAVKAAETARQMAVLSGFVFAASLLIAAAAAWWAAGLGGRHRDEGRVFPAFGRLQ